MVLPTTAAFSTSGGPVGSPATGPPLVLARLTDEHGRCGWAEAGPLPKWSETLDSVVDAVRQDLGPAVLGRDSGDLGRPACGPGYGDRPGPAPRQVGGRPAAFDLLGR